VDGLEAARTRGRNQGARDRRLTAGASARALSAGAAQVCNGRAGSSGVCACPC
jgi:hypothetical protein